LGLQTLLMFDTRNSKDENRTSKLVVRYIYIFVAVGALIALFLLFGKSIYLSWIADTQRPLSATARETAYHAAALDALKMLLIMAAGSFLILQYLKNKIRGNALVGALIALLVVDLWFVDFKLNNPHPRSDRSEYFAETPAVRFLKSQQGTEPFRIFPAYDDKPENWYQYHLIQNIRGYHAAKLKIYQEFIEETGFDARNRYGFPPLLEKYLQVEMSNGKPELRMVPVEELPAARLQADNAVMDMLNVRYLISYYPVPDPRYQVVLEDRPAVLENTGVPGRAFFVDDIKVLAGKEAFFSYLKSGQFNPAKEAVLEEEPPFQIEPSPENSVRVISYDIHEIQLEAHVAKPALLVLSEIYYPAGWKAFVDSKETKVYKTDYILRSIFLQPGDHQIKFVFESTTFKLGLWITFSILFVLFGTLVYNWRFRRQTADGKHES
ncbi:MAG TPA: YfhO family protein, partial [bacterium]